MASTEPTVPSDKAAEVHTDGSSYPDAEKASVKAPSITGKDMAVAGEPSAVSAHHNEPVEKPQPTVQTGEANPPPSVSAPPSAISQTKQDLKNEKAFNRVTAAEAKANQAKLKGALKEGEKSQKTEAHAAKQEAKAKKLLDKAVKKEYKLNKKLVEMKSKYDAAVVELEKAKARLELKENHHETQVALRDEKMKLLNDLRASHPTSPTL